MRGLFHHVPEILFAIVAVLLSSATSGCHHKNVDAKNTLPVRATLDTIIGDSVQPRETDSIAVVLPFTGRTSELGFQPGAIVPDFILWDADGKPFHLDDELRRGLPVVLISGSYTCSVFRQRIPQINALAARLHGRATVRIVYTIEAHPSSGSCPYPPTPEAETDNQRDHIRFLQPITMKDRRLGVARLMAFDSLTPPILIDGPRNEWWRKFGVGPNVAYLIGPGRRVLYSQPWFTDDDMMFTRVFEKLVGGLRGPA